MKQAKKHIMPIILFFIIVISIVCIGENAGATGQIYVNDRQSLLSGDISSAYAVGGSGDVSIVGGTYAITGDGIQEIGKSAPSGIPSGADDGTTVIVRAETARVGLNYYYSNSRNTALTSASLENRVGSGYQFGYYDSSRVFRILGRTSETKLTMVPNVNTVVSGGTVGCYFIRLFPAYGDFETARIAASRYTDGFPAYINGAYYAMIGNYLSQSEANSARASLGVNGEVFTGSSRCVTVTRTGSTSVLFAFDLGTNANLAVRPVSSSGKAVTWFRGESYYGDFEYFRYISDRLTVINVVNIEDYIKGVVPIEMSASWPIEALKAQAICARSYFATHIGSYSKYGFDLTADVYSQAYLGTRRATTNSDAAVDATRGEYITYNGSICNAFYYSSNGGASEDSENIFFEALPYCRGIFDPFEDDVPQSLNSRKSWRYEYTGAQLASRLRSYGYNGGDIVTVQPTYSRTNNVIRLQLSDANGASITLTKSNCYSAMGLPSVRYTISKSAADPSVFVIDGSGWGHNVGMSQFGAYSMAQYHGLNYRQILRFYYTGINISKGVMA